MSKIKWFGPVVAVLLLALAMGGPALGGKGGKGKPDGGGGATPTGTVHFFAGLDQFTIDPDGSNEADLPINVVDGTPSVGLHNGSGWMVLIRPVAGTYLNGRQRQEVFIVREDGNETHTVQLTNDASFEPMWKQQPPQWSADGEVVDGKVSFLGWEYDAAGDVVGAGIYSQQVAYDVDDNPTGPLNNRDLVVTLTTYDPAPDFPNDPGDPYSYVHSWSPDGEKLAYDFFDATAVGGSRIYIHNLQTNASTYLADGGTPAWAPDASLISYIALVNLRGAGDLMTINPAGGEATLLVASGASRKVLRGLFHPTWSPDSQFLVYTRFEHDNRNPWTDSLIRIARDGSGTKTLVAPVHLYMRPNAWR